MFCEVSKGNKDIEGDGQIWNDRMGVFETLADMTAIFIKRFL